jgi:hypothetical protein
MLCVPKPKIANNSRSPIIFVGGLYLSKKLTLARERHKTIHTPTNWYLSETWEMTAPINTPKPPHVIELSRNAPNLWMKLGISSAAGSDRTWDVVAGIALASDAQLAKDIP